MEQFFKKTLFKKTLPINTPLFSSFRHKNEGHSLKVRNLEANCGEGR